MKILLPIMLAASSPAIAAPTYLACSVDQSATRLDVEVTTDEDNQRATVLLPSTGRTVTRRAIFSPTEVAVPDEETTWIVDRVDLRFRRVVAIGEKRSVYLGKCSIKPAPAKRAF